MKSPLYASFFIAQPEIDLVQTKITIVFEFVYKRKIYNAILHPFMKGKFQEDLQGVVG